jgi:outer membrane protein assembly factor BamE (lipoprotein component of BamABCDE complex)
MKLKSMPANRILRVAAVALAALLAGCASYGGNNLIAGKSTAAEVQASMGAPAEKLALPGGESVWYYPHGPQGRHTFAVTLGPDGVLRGIDQRLTMANVEKLVQGRSTAKEVRELLGPPPTVRSFPRLQRVVWIYPMQLAEERRILWVQFSPDDIAREVIETHDYDSDPPSGPADGGMH